MMGGTMKIKWDRGARAENVYFYLCKLVLFLCFFFEWWNLAEFRD